MWAKIWARGVINDGVGRPASRAINFSTYGVKYPLYRLCSSLIFQSSPVITPRHRGERIHSGESLIAWVDRCGHAVAGMLQGLSRKASRSAVKTGTSCARAVAM